MPKKSLVKKTSEGDRPSLASPVAAKTCELRDASEGGEGGNEEAKILALLLQLEAARVVFHDALSAGRMSFLDAKIALRDRAIELGLDGVPTQRLDACFRLQVSSQPVQIEVALDLTRVELKPPCDDVRLASAEREQSLQAQDPLYWFTLCPPRDLVQAQSNYRKALHAAIAVAKIQAQICLLLVTTADPC